MLVYHHPGYDPFFRIRLGGGDDLRREVFYLAYHLHWSWESVMGLDVLERRAYIRLLAEQIQRENDEIEQLRRSWQ